MKNLFLVMLIGIIFFSCSKKNNDPAPTSTITKPQPMYDVSKFQNRWWMMRDTTIWSAGDTTFYYNLLDYQSNGIALDSGIAINTYWQDSTYTPTGSFKYKVQTYMNDKPTQIWLNAYTVNPFNGDTSITSNHVVSYFNNSDTLVLDIDIYTLLK